MQNRRQFVKLTTLALFLQDALKVNLQMPIHFVCSRPCLQFQSLQPHLAHRRNYAVQKSISDIRRRYKRIFIKESDSD